MQERLLTSINNVTFDTAADKTVDFNGSTTLDCGTDVTPGGLLVTASHSGTGHILKLANTNASFAATLTVSFNGVAGVGNTINFNTTGAGAGIPLEFDSNQGYRFNSATGKNFHVNQDNLDCDSIFEGDTDADLLVVNAGDNRVGISTNAPDTLFHVAGASHLAGAVQIGGDVTFDDTQNMIFNTTAGTQIATATTQKLGFWGTTPVVQLSAYTPTNVSTDRAYDANATSVDELADILGTLIADLQTLGLVA